MGARCISPQGKYRVTRLTIPTGVELRGPLGGGIHGIASDSWTCILLGYDGKNSTAPASDPALLTLSAGSGVRGFDIGYPEQGYGSSASPVLPFPFAIRGTGAHVWVENVTLANGYNLIDFGTFRCDDHYVSGVEGTALNTGIFVGGGSEGGRLERVMITRGLSQGFRNLDDPAIAILSAYTRENTVPFIFGELHEGDHVRSGLLRREDRVADARRRRRVHGFNVLAALVRYDLPGRVCLRGWRQPSVRGRRGGQLVGNLVCQLLLLRRFGRRLRDDELGKCDQPQPLRRHFPFPQREKPDSRKTGHGELDRIGR